MLGYPLGNPPRLNAHRVEYPISLSVSQFLFVLFCFVFLWKSGFKFEHFQKGSRQLHVKFSIRQFNVKATDIQNRENAQLQQINYR